MTHEFWLDIQANKQRLYTNQNNFYFVQLKEKRRIQEAGGFVSLNGVWRVQGVLATSRALGDFPLKVKLYIPGGGPRYIYFLEYPPPLKKRGMGCRLLQITHLNKQTNFNSAFYKTEYNFHNDIWDGCSFTCVLFINLKNLMKFG